MSLKEKAAGLEARNAKLQSELDSLSSERDALRVELERFRDFASCASEWRWEMDADLRYASVTEQCEEATGLQIEKLIGKRRDEFGDFQPGDPVLMRHLADLEARRPFRNFEYSAIGDDGVERHFSVSGKPVFGVDGAFQGYRGIARDITERKMMERALAQREQELHSITENLTVLIARIDSDGRYRFASRIAETWYARPMSEIVGKTIPEIFGGGAYETLQPHIETVLSGETANFEGTIDYPDGKTREIEITLVPDRAANGEVQGWFALALDLSSLKQAERALQGTEGQLRTVTDNLPALIIRYDRDRRITLVNKTAEQWYARPASEILGKTIAQVLGQENATRFAPHLSWALEGHDVSFEVSLSFPDGMDRETEVTYVPDRAPDGKVQGVFALVLDATARRQAERALEGREVQLRTVTDHLPVLIVRFDRDRRISLVNKTAEQWYARPASEIIGKTVAEMLGEDVGERFGPHLGWALEGQNVSFEVNIPYPDGIDRDIEVTYVPDRAPDGSVQGVFALVQDGTARKLAEKARRESEARTAAIVENSPAPIFLKDLEGRFLLANREFPAMFNVKDKNVIGKTSFEVHPPEEAAAYAAQDREVIAQKTVISREAVAEQEDGSQRFIVVTKFPVFDADGEMIAVGGVNMDITELKRLEGDLLRKERLAAMGQLTGTVAHELRNPLGAVAMSLGVIQKKCQEAGIDLGRALSRAARGIERSDRIVTDLLDFARARGLRPVPGRPDSWLAELLDEHGIPAGITVVRELGAGEETVEFDAEWLRRAVINVLDNACQALAGDSKCPDNGGEPTVTVSTGAAGGRFTVTIADNGPGIPLDILPQVTEPLVSSKNFGTGLGLPTVKRIMEDHGGGLEIESGPCKGARITLWLPIGDKAA